MDQIQLAFSFIEAPKTCLPPMLSSDAQSKNDDGPSNSQDVAPRDDPAADTCLHLPSPATEAVGTEGVQVPEPSVACLPENLQQVLAFLADDQSKKGGEMRSALRMVGEVLGRPLEAIPADLSALRPLLTQSSPAAIGMTTKRWGGVRSLLLSALREVGFDVLPGRDPKGHSKDWKRLFALTPAKSTRNGVSRFASYCTRRGIEPDSVTEEVFGEFRTALFERSDNADPMRVISMTAISWNKAGGSPGWPKLMLDQPADDRRYALPWDSFPESLHAEIEEYLGACGNSDPFDDAYANPLRPDTVRQRRKELRQVASALAGSSFPQDQISTLATLTAPANAKAALRHLRQRNGGKTSQAIAGKAHLLSTIARHWVKDPSHFESLRQYAAGLRKQVKHKGLTQKNRERLRQFTLDANIQALVSLPERVFREACKDQASTPDQALRVMRALAVEILLVAPMRAKNLTALETERHLIVVRRGSRSSRHIVIPTEETKTTAPFEMEIPERSRTLLETYLTKYRPSLTSQTSPYLFPGRKGCARSSSAFGQALSKFILRETGLKMNPHLFRHLAAKLHLDAHPQQIETVRMILGHTSTRTTLKSYAEFSSDAAFRSYDATVEAHRKDADRSRPRLAGRGGGDARK